MKHARKPMHSIYSFFRAAYRLLLFLFIIHCYFLNAIALKIIFYLTYLINPHPKMPLRKRLSLNSQRYARWMLKAFNVKLVCKHKIPANEGSLLVGNHIGFIDIVCLLALTDAVFITSMEMKQTPFLGQIADLAGCAYVDRRNRKGIQTELKDITEVLQQGFRLVLYAESVASNGEQVLPFKKTLLMSAGKADRPIRPFVFNFRKVNGGPVLFEHRDSLCWYGSRSFLSAMWKSLHLNSVVCEIEFLPLVYPDPTTDRKELAHDLHQKISNLYVPFVRNTNHCR